MKKNNWLRVVMAMAFFCFSNCVSTKVAPTKIAAEVSTKKIAILKITNKITVKKIDGKVVSFPVRDKIIIEPGYHEIYFSFEEAAYPAKSVARSEVLLMSAARISVVHSLVVRGNFEAGKSYDICTSLLHFKKLPPFSNKQEKEDYVLIGMAFLREK